MADSSTILAVVFDLDDTLYAERDYVRSGYTAVSRHLQESLGRTDDFSGWLWKRFEAGHTAGAFNALGEHFDLDLDTERILDLVGVYREHTPDIQPLEGMVDLLQSLRDAGRPLGLLSDGFLPAQQIKLDALGVGTLFDAICFTEAMGRDAWKPSAAGFKAVAEDLNVPHAACAYVSDNPAKDFVAPNALGWLTIQYRFPGQIHANNPAPNGGKPQEIVNTPEGLLLQLLPRAQ